MAEDSEFKFRLDRIDIHTRIRRMEMENVMQWLMIYGHFIQPADDGDCLERWRRVGEKCL